MQNKSKYLAQGGRCTHMTLALVSLFSMKPLAVAAADATWQSDPVDDQYYTAANWSGAVTPDGTAFFGASSQTAIIMDDPVYFSGSIDGWTFNEDASDYAFDLSYDDSFEFFGTGIVVNGGSVSITNNKKMMFWNSSTAGSSTIVNHGEISFVSFTTAGSAAITNNGNLFFDHFSSAGGATITNTNMLKFRDFSTAVSATIINNAGGTIDIASLQPDAINIGSIEGSGSIHLGSKQLVTGGLNTSTTVAGVISGSGSLEKTGTGMLTLTGSNAYTGGTIISAGILQVDNDGIISGNTIINADGTLLNNGTVGTVDINGGALLGSGTIGTVVINGGVIAPGNSIGILSVDGNVDFSAGGTYAVEVDAAGNADHISATGSANLTNGSVSVIPEAGEYDTSTDYTILTAAGGLGGTTFGDVSSTMALLTPTLTYDTNNVYLNLQRNDVAYASVANTPNQISVGKALDTLVGNGTGGSEELFNHLNVLTAEGAAQAYDSLSGVQHTHSSLIALQTGNRFKGLLFDRLRGGDAGLDSRPESGRGWWVRGTGGYGDIESTGNARGARYDAAGSVLGLDTQVDNQFALGAAFGYSRTDADVALGSLQFDSYQAALYGNWLLADDYYVSGVAGLGYHEIESSRRIAVGALSSQAKADYHAWTGHVAVEGGRTFTLNESTRVTSLVGLEYAHVNRSEIVETDHAGLGLAIDAERLDSLRSVIGTRLEHTNTTSGGMRINPTFELAWVHEFLDEQAVLNAGLTTDPSAYFSVQGPALDRDRARMGLGLRMRLSDTTSLDLNYRAELAGSDQQHSTAATFSMSW